MEGPEGADEVHGEGEGSAHMLPEVTEDGPLTLEEELRKVRVATEAGELEPQMRQNWLRTLRFEAMYAHRSADGPAEDVRRILEEGLDQKAHDSDGNTVLHKALAEKTAFPEAVPLILEQGADPNAKNLRGATPLHYMAHSWPEFLDDILIHARPSINAQTTAGETPLHYAVVGNEIVAAEKLLAARADPSLCDDRGKTPLLYTELSEPFIKLLLDRGASANEQDPEGKTVLHSAAMHGDMAVVRLLLTRGADPLAVWHCREGRDDKHWRPLDLSNKAKHHSVSWLLQGAEKEWQNFILQMHVEGEGPLVNLSFRPMSGTLAAAFSWNLSDPVAELPAKILSAMETSGFRPERSLCATQLKLLYSSWPLQTGPSAPPLAVQLATPTPAGSKSSRRRRRQRGG